MEAPSRVALELGLVDLEQGLLLTTPPVRLSPMETRLLGYLAARPGQTLDKEQLLVEVWGYAPESRSRTVYSTMDRLRRKLEQDPAHPRHLLTIGRSGYAFQPLLTPTDQAPTLPIPADTFVGRADELATGAVVLGQPGALLTLRGPGGVGKTRLALELGERLREQLPGGVHLCDLSAATTSDEVLSAIAQTVGLAPGGDTDRARQLMRCGRVLGSRGPSLLILDNAEGSVTPLAELLAGWSRRPTILITTRVALGLPDETVLALEPLALPTPDAPTSDATELFLVRARSLRPGWCPTPEEHEAVAALVTLFEGLPLAIELAARWARVLSPTALWTRVSEGRLALQASHDSARPERHQSLDAAIRWSWDTLPPAAQQALACCSVFRGGFDVDAAEAVIGSPSALEQLDLLADRSLLRSTSSDRWTLLASIQAFAAERLGEDPELQRCAILRHGAHYATLGRDRAREALHRQDAAGIQARAVELPNLKAAARRGAADDAALAALAASDVLRILGPFRDAVPLLEHALASPELAPGLQVRLLEALGQARRYLSDPDTALQELHRALQLAREHAPEELAQIEHSLGAALLVLGPLDEAKIYLERALQRSQHSGDLYRQGVIRAEIAGIDIRTGRADAAAHQYEAALKLLRQVGARRAEAVYLGNLGIAHMKCARYEAARDCLHDALRLHRQLGAHRFEGQVLCNLGLLHVLWDRPTEGIAHYRQSLDAAERSGDLKDEGITHANLAWLLVRQGEWSEARRHLDTADWIFEALKLPLQQADAALNRAELARAEGDLEAIEASLQIAEALIEKGGYAEHRPRLLLERGALCLARDDRDGAEALLQRAEALIEAMKLGTGHDAVRAAAALREALQQ